MKWGRHLRTRFTVVECGLRRDVVYGDHKELVDEFRARAKAQNFTPQVVQNMADENIVLRKALTKIKADLAAERERVHALVRAATELSLELEQTREELAVGLQVTRPPGPRGTGRTPGGSSAYSALLLSVELLNRALQRQRLHAATFHSSHILP